ncbi:MAG TPA: acetylxylan esterase [Thermoguttaceae bacterium]|nr:acetylxylan esterase [Thermoguttaceae bacterium]
MNDHLPLGRSLSGRGWVLPLFLVLGLPLLATAEAPRVLAPGKLPDDKRLGDLVTLDGYFPFAVPGTPDAWAERSERVHRQMLVTLGLWPMPTATSANAVVHGKIDRGEYTVEKVYLESFPGHFVTGNLYRPKGRSGPGPGVLCPHGHWREGRFYRADDKTFEQQLKGGAEKFDPSGRFPLQARCAKLARMGCVVFHYDMVGYADSVQLAHRPGLREAMNTPENWGYFSPQAEARLQNMMGLQTYNSIRVLDWFGELPEVDAKRIAVTGASGGGTQTFILSAVDRRPAVAFPAVMVSTAMQGGCTCENACYLRVGTGNIEIAGLIAPRPLGMTAANDWTQEILTKGLPELEQLYKMLGVEDLVTAEHFSFPHNYNYVSRSVMYGWLNKHLKLGRKEPIVEEDFEPLSVEELTVWDDAHPKPPGGDDHERSLLRWITKDSEKQMAGLVPSDAESLARYREIVGGAVDVMIGRGLPEEGAIEVQHEPKEELGDYAMVRGLVQYPAQGEEVPIVVLGPGAQPWNKQVVIWVDAAGKAALFDEGGKPKPAVKRLLSAGMAVVGVDLFGQGEFTADGKPIAKAPLDPKRTDYAGYTYGYNHPVFAKRVHDVLSLVALARSVRTVEKVHLIGLGGAGHWVAAARAQAGKAVDRAVVDTAGFRFANLTDFADPDFLPGGAKYFDLPGILALSAPGELWLAGEAAEPPQVIVTGYKAAGCSDKLTAFDGEAARESAALEWLMR